MIRDADALIAVHPRNTGSHTATLTALTRQLGSAVITMDPATRTVAIAKN